MFEDDYLLRLIKEMVRTVLKLLFHIDFKEEDPVSVVFESEDAEKTLYSLIHLADQGFINDAENQLYDFTQNPKIWIVKDCTSLLFTFESAGQ